jgi:hypothetical protein
MLNLPRLPIRILAIATALIVACTGCSADNKGPAYHNEIPGSAKAALEKADQFELLSVDPAQNKGNFHGFRVLGRTQVKDADTRKKLVAAFEKGVEENDGGAGMCFNPRHGIRVTYKSKVVEFVICFQCSHVDVYGDEKRDHFLTTGSPQPVFDQVLREAGVPLPEPAKPEPPARKPEP